MKKRKLYNWLHETETVITEPTDEISIYEDKTGGKWVRVKIFDEDFLISPMDYRGGIGSLHFTFENAVDEMQFIGLSLWTKKQVHLVIAYLGEINEKLAQIGGEIIDSGYWCSEKSGDFHAWCVLFKSHGMAITKMATDMRVRPIIATPKH